MGKGKGRKKGKGTAPVNATNVAPGVGRDAYPAVVGEARFSHEDVANSLRAVERVALAEMRDDAAHHRDAVLAWRLVLSQQLHELGFVYVWDQARGLTVVASRDGMLRVAIPDDDLAPVVSSARPAAAAFMLAACAVDATFAWWVGGDDA